MAFVITNLGTNNGAVGAGNVITAAATVSNCVIVVIANDASTSGSGSVVDNHSPGNTYNTIVSQTKNNSAANGFCTIFYADSASITSGDLITYAKGVAGSAASVTAAAITGTNLGASLDSALNAVAFGSSTAPSVTSGTGGSGSLLIAMGGNTSSAITNDATWSASITGLTATPRLSCGDSTASSPKTYTQSLACSVVWAALVTGFDAPDLPKNQYDWPNPRLPLRSDDTWDYVGRAGALLLPAPIVITYLPCVVADWGPSPVPAWNASLSNWAKSSPPLLAAVVGTPFTQLDQSNPRLAAGGPRDFVNLPGALRTPPPAKPLTQVDQSNPRAVLSSAILWSWSQWASLGLAAKPPINNEWILPRPAPSPDRSWTNPYGAWIATPVAGLPFAQEDQSNPRLAAGGPRDFVNLPGALRTPPPAKPLTQNDQSNPIRSPIWLRDWFVQSNALLSATPAFPFTQDDQSNPRGPIDPTALRNWIGRPGVLITAAPSALPQANEDWPLPRSPIVSPELRSWLRGPQIQPADTNTYLPCVVTTWQIPESIPRPAGISDWTNSLLAVEYVFRAPFIVRRWPLQYDPAVHSQAQPNTLATTLSTVVVSKPPAKVDWPLPRSAPATLRDFVGAPGALRTPPPAKPFTQADQSNPARLVAWLRDWIDQSNALLVAPAAGVPFSQKDHTNPRLNAVTPRDWISQATALLSAAPVAAKPFTQIDWSLPRAATQGLRDFAGLPGALQTPAAPAPVPFTQDDQSNPRLAPVWLRDWVNRSSALLAAAAKPFSQVDQSNPQSLVATNRNWINRSTPLPATSARPFTQVDQSNPTRSPLWLRDWIARSNALLATPPAPRPFTQVDQSNPRLPFQPNRDWTGRTVGILTAIPVTPSLVCAAINLYPSVLGHPTIGPAIGISDLDVSPAVGGLPEINPAVLGLPDLRKC